jgi:hypothetical protein
MTNIIKPKRSESSGAPTSSDLAVGELAINLADGTIHSKKTDGTVVSLGASSSAASITFASANDTHDLGDLTTFSHTADLGSIAETENNGLTPTDLGLLHYDEIFRNLTVNTSLTAMGLTYPTSDGSAGQFLKTDGSGALSFSSVTQATGNELENVVEDTTPQLGGNLDLNSSDITGTGNIDITGNATITSTDAGSSAGPDLILYRNSASPADGDYLGQIQFKGRQDGPGDEIYAKVTGKISDATNGTEDGLIETAIKGGGSFTIVSRQRSDELQLINGVGLSVAGATTLTGAATLSSTLSVDGTTTQGATDYYTKQYVLYGTTTDATETEVLIGGSTRISVPTDTTMFYEVSIVARRTDATGESGAWHLKGCADNFSGTVADVGDVYEIAVAQDDLNLSVDVRADDTNNAINVFVTGVASKTYRWTAIVKTIEVAE